MAVPAKPLSSLSVSHATRSALTEAGYATTSDVLQISAADLSAELGVSLTQATDILRQCAEPAGPSRPSSPTHPTTAPSHLASQIQSSTAAALLSTDSLPRFSTCVDELDDLLAHFSPAGPPPAPDDTALGNGHSAGGLDGTQDPKGKRRLGGITAGMTVELAGPPGIGKTSVAMGIVFDARVRACRHIRKRRRSSQPERADDGSMGGEVLIIDTEGGIPPDRLFKLAELVTQHSSTKAQAILDGIHLVRVATQVQMVAFLNMLDEWLQQHPQVDLIIIDSLSYHFRQPSLDLSTRRRIMDTVKQQIAKATTVHHCAVIVINQMATKLLSAEGKRVNFDTGEKAVLMPQLGEMWQTAKTVRVALFRGQPGNEIRYAHVGTSSDAERGEWARFDVDSDGLPMDIDVVS